MARKVFYSFHYKPDCTRAAKVRNMGVVEGNKPASDNDWEEIAQGGDRAIQKWIDDQLNGKSCNVVLIGENTAGRKWINYEIKSAWNNEKGLVGVYIHRLKNLDGYQASKGRNPFEDFTIGEKKTQMSSVVSAYNPPYADSKDVYNYISENIADWIEEAIDIRANVVRNHWLTKPDREAAGFYDASIWETTKRRGDVPLKRLINSGLENTSNTCVLVGSDTYARPWVRYEILKSFKRGNHLFGVHINSIKGRDGLTKWPGPNPFEYVGVTFSASGETATLWEKIGDKWVEYDKVDDSASYRFQVNQQYRGNGYNLGNWYPVYDWNGDEGFNNFATWVK